LRLPGFSKGEFKMDTFGMVITGIGVLFLFLGNLGVLRLPDVYNRIQAGTKCTTLGAFLTIIGVGIMEPSWFWKALLIALFVLATNPISSHAIARASSKSGVSLCDQSVVDKTKDFEEFRERA
jgi:multicomponent Na+:H+ antiporter subunit G